jgi:hypothetical protein
MNDLEIWDCKGTRGDSPYMRDYVLQLLTSANLYRERTGKRPERCVLFFLNEKKRDDQLVALQLGATSFSHRSSLACFSSRFRGQNRSTRTRNPSFGDGFS